MADWTANWQEELDDRARACVQRATGHLGDLAVRYVALGALTVPGRAAPVGARPVPGPRVPVRLDVVDLARDVERFATRHAGLVAGALRAGSPGVGSTVAALAYIRANLGPASLADPSLADDVEAGAGSLRWRARRLVGEVSAAFPVDVDCPECGLVSLWVHPGRGIVKCGVDSCGSEWAVGDLAVPAWSVGSDG